MTRCLALLIVWFGAFAPMTVLAQQPKVFYLVGAEEAHAIPGAPPDQKQYKGIHLYELDAATMHVVRSVPMNAGSGMLTGDRKTIVLVWGGDDDKSTLQLFSVPDWKVQGSMEIPDSEMPENPKDDEHIPCLDQIFVHPVTGITYFSCEITVGASEQLVVDPFNKKIIGLDLPFRTNARTFLYDSKRQWLYLSDAAPGILDTHNHLIGRLDGPEIYIPNNDRPVPAGILGMAPLPSGNLMLMYMAPARAPDGSWTGWTAPRLSTYDPAAKKVLRTWTEDHTYTRLLVGRIHGVRYTEPTPAQVPYEMNNVPVPSRDGSRLFGIENASFSSHPQQDGILWDPATLDVLRRWTLPEAQGYNCSQNGTGTGLIACFASAPDGRGMWFFGRSGKIYRLDDHTGELIDEVKLPFHLVSLIREP